MCTVCTVCTVSSVCTVCTVSSVCTVCAVSSVCTVCTVCTLHVFSLCSGLAQCAELCWQLRGEAGPRQVPNARIALQHNIGLGGAVIVGLYKLGFPHYARTGSSKRSISAVGISGGEPRCTIVFDEIERRLKTVSVCVLCVHTVCLSAIHVCLLCICYWVNGIVALQAKNLLGVNMTT